jgi:hypothetical protein
VHYWSPITPGNASQNSHEFFAYPVTADDLK